MRPAAREFSGQPADTNPGELHQPDGALAATAKKTKKTRKPRKVRHTQPTVDPKDFPWSDPAFRAVVQKLSPATPEPPSPTEADRKKSYQAYRAWQTATMGFAFCESEVRNMYDFNLDGSV